MLITFSFYQNKDLLSSNCIGYCQRKINKDAKIEKCKIKTILFIPKSNERGGIKQLRKRFNEERVKELLKEYEDSTVKLEIIRDIVGVARVQFFRLLKQYRQNELSLSYKWTSIDQSLEKEHNKLVLYELKERFKLIQDSKIPIYRYNYSCAQQAILKKYNVKVSRQTIVK